MNQLDAVLREIMEDISKAITTNENLQKEVDKMGDEKTIGNWNGQKVGLQRALEMVAATRNKYV